MLKMPFWQALDALETPKLWSWPADDEYPGVFLARGDNDKGVIQFNDRSTVFGEWDGERGTDGALLTLDNGDVYNECGGLVSKGRS